MSYVQMTATKLRDTSIFVCFENEHFKTIWNTRYPNLKISDLKQEMSTSPDTCDRLMSLSRLSRST